MAVGNYGKTAAYAGEPQFECREAELGAHIVEASHQEVIHRLMLTASRRAR